MTPIQIGQRPGDGQARPAVNGSSRGGAELSAFAKHLGAENIDVRIIGLPGIGGQAGLEAGLL